MKSLKPNDIDFKCMHEDALRSLESLEQLMGTVRKVAEVAGSYLAMEGEEDEEDYDEDAEADMDELEGMDANEGGSRVVDDKALYGKRETLEDNSDKTNVVNRASKGERKRLAVIKLSRMK